MLSMYYPSKWRNKKTGKTWVLTYHPSLGRGGEPGVMAQCQEDTGASGEIYWTNKGPNELWLYHILCQPKRTGLGALLVFAFAEAAVTGGYTSVPLALANPQEHGLHLHMGFAYDEIKIAARLDQALQAPDPRAAWVDLNSFRNVSDDPEEHILITKLHIMTPMSGNSNRVRTQSEHSAAKTWEPVVSFSEKLASMFGL